MAEKKTKIITGFKVKPCNCEHEFQDKEYGKGMRFHNFGPVNTTCTVCGKSTKN